MQPAAAEFARAKKLRRTTLGQPLPPPVVASLGNRLWNRVIPVVVSESQDPESILYLKPFKFFWLSGARALDNTFFFNKSSITQGHCVYGEVIRIGFPKKNRMSRKPKS